MVRKTLGVGDLLNRYRNHCNEILKWGKETGFNSKYCMNKRKFIAKEQCGASEQKITKRKHQGYGEEG